MTADVIELQFGKPAEHKGNGAREALVQVATCSGIAPQPAERWADLILIDLAMRGFKVVPL